MYPFDTPFQAITESQIRRLETEQIPEAKQLDYKRDLTVVGTRMTVDATKNCLSVSTSRHRFGEYRTISNYQDAVSYWIEIATGYCYRFTSCWPSSGFRQTEGDTGCGVPLCDHL
ncbi:MAG: hypothetical protein AAFP04_11430 [Myxococcota bacterium]